jgi:exopolysaccharide biosynthesis protein
MDMKGEPQARGASPDRRASERIQPAKRKRRLHPAWMVAIDVLLIGVALVVYALFDHVLPQRLSADLSKVSQTTITQRVATSGGTTSAAVTTGTTATGTEAAAANSSTSASNGQAASLTFCGEFSDGDAVATDSSYTGTNVNVTLTEVEADGVTYYVEDIYVRNIEALRSAFAGDTYGRAVTESVLSMTENNDAVAAVNGDYYGIGSAGVVIRNGVLYSSDADGDVCVLFRDGTMKVYAAAEFDADAVVAAGAWQAWDFGPSLLTDDGAAISSFSSRIVGANPRTAIGYYEPGHYCFVVVDGRQAGYSDGMSLASLSTLMEKLGCSVAYNLDGGKSSTMTFQGQIANQPTDGGREVTDIIYVTDVDGES